MKNVRTCISCRSKRDKSEMLKFVKNKNGDISLDPSQNKEGRGAYVCNNDVCLKKLIQSKGLNRSYKTAVQSEIYDKIGEKIGDK